MEQVQDRQAALAALAVAVGTLMAVLVRRVVRAQEGKGATEAMERLAVLAAEAVEQVR
jgi:hypothetical protein